MVATAPTALTKFDAQVQLDMKRITEINREVFTNLLELGEIFYRWKYEMDSFWTRHGDFSGDDKGFCAYVSSHTGKGRGTITACIALKSNLDRLVAAGADRDEAIAILSKAVTTVDGVRAFAGALTGIPKAKLGDVLPTVEHWTGDMELMVRSLRELAGKTLRAGAATGSRTGRHQVVLEPDGLKILGNPSKEFVAKAAKVTGCNAFQVADDRVILRAARQPAPPPPAAPQEPSEPEPDEPKGGSVNSVWNPIFRPWAVRVAEERGLATVPDHRDFEQWLYDALVYFDENILAEGQTVMDFLSEASQQTEGA